MPTTDPRIDAYIERAPAFAQPILRLLRQSVHSACPEVAETIKWGMPFFTLEGRILAHMAAFKQHCAFGFWKAMETMGRGKAGEAMGQFGRIASIADLPPRQELVRLIRDAATRPPAPAGTASVRRVSKPPLPVPPRLAQALTGNAAARAAFDALSPSHRREYVEWISEAKREETTERRVAQAVAWLAEGKPRHWKHMKG